MKGTPEKIEKKTLEYDGEEAMVCAQFMNDINARIEKEDAIFGQQHIIGERIESIWR